VLKYNSQLEALKQLFAVFYNEKLLQLTVQGCHGTDISLVASLFMTYEGRESVTLINVHDKHEASRLMTTLDC
jgi:hypothetical protein